jgi:S1-C subfamily serine protease
MKYFSKISGTCAGILLVGGLLAQSLHPKTVAWEVNSDSGSRQSSTSEKASEQQLHQLARAITVKILSKEGSGSGILVRREGQVYTVLTNQHVLEQASDNYYRIQTPDGQIYQAKVLNSINFDGNDLSLLSFHSSRTYLIASFGDSSNIRVGDAVFAAGFPFFQERRDQNSGFILTTGQISMLSDQTFDGGYRIGYNNLIEKGMSGGPLLNDQGQVIGINGLDASPVWGNSYTFSDGSVASKFLKRQMNQFSWAIPSQTLWQLGLKFSDHPSRSPFTPLQLSPPQTGNSFPTPPSRERNIWSGWYR